MTAIPWRREKSLWNKGHTACYTWFCHVCALCEAERARHLNVQSVFCRYLRARGCTPCAAYAAIPIGLETKPLTPAVYRTFSVDSHFYFWEIDPISKTIEQPKAEQAEAQQQLAYSFDIALQNKFSLEENIALAI